MGKATKTSTTVLIVEDDPALQTLYREYLEPDCAVRVAATGEETLDQMTDDIDVILLDRQLPDIDGETVLAELREHGYDTPVAIITGIEADERIFDLAFDEYLFKPVDKDVLRETTELLANRVELDSQSREIFRTVSKADTIAGNTPTTIGPAAAQDLKATLDDTLDELVQKERSIVAQNEPSQSEIRELLEEIQEHKLPEDIATLVNEYQALRDARPLFMWKWVHHLAPNNSLPCVPADSRERTAGLKTLLILYITILDDTLEKRHDRETFHRIAQIPYRHSESAAASEESQAVAFARRLWESIESDLASAPAYETYRELFLFDLKQAINAIEYSELVISNPELATVGDLERYESHNMVMLAYADIDLMFSHADFSSDIAPLREAIMTAQQMARIGNWVSTWERELKEGDFSAGPIVYALEHDIVTEDMLTAATRDPDAAAYTIEQITDAGIEKHFLHRWERCYHELVSLNNTLEEMDLSEFIAGTEQVLRYHLASRGLK